MTPFRQPPFRPASRVRALLPQPNLTKVRPLPAAERSPSRPRHVRQLSTVRRHTTCLVVRPLQPTKPAAARRVPLHLCPAIQARRSINPRQDEHPHPTVAVCTRRGCSGGDQRSLRHLGGRLQERPPTRPRMRPPIRPAGRHQPSDGSIRGVNARGSTRRRLAAASERPEVGSQGQPLAVSNRCDRVSGPQRPHSGLNNRVTPPSTPCSSRVRARRPRHPIPSSPRSRGPINPYPQQSRCAADGLPVPACCRFDNDRGLR